MNKKITVTGGGGFIGAYLVKKLVKEGYSVSVIDTMIRGSVKRLSSVEKDINLFNIDIRDEDEVVKAIKGNDLLIHLAAINGTENFYNKPELVLDVGIRGALAVVNACKKSNVPDLIVASSAEVYQNPKVIPTPESIELMLPNSLNPRYSYGGSKIISELIALNYHRDHFRKIQIFRPHNIYGPDMGWKHVIPQLILRAQKIIKSNETLSLIFPIQGDGTETRAFCYVDDLIEGIMTMYENGGNREIFHIGNDQEISIKKLVLFIANLFGKEFVLQKTHPAEGGTPRRCPDISKMNNLGYAPKINIEEGLKRTFEWYIENQSSHSNDLM